MQGARAQIEREMLFREISGIISQWPELERKIFSQAHYGGQSVEDISRSINLNAGQVGSILKQCERRLYASLKGFRASAGAGTDAPPARAANPAECGNAAAVSS